MLSKEAEKKKQTVERKENNKRHGCGGPISKSRGTSTATIKEHLVINKSVGNGRNGGVHDKLKRGNGSPGELSCLLVTLRIAFHAGVQERGAAVHVRTGYQAVQA